MGKIQPKTCEGGELTKNQLARQEADPRGLQLAGTKAKQRLMEDVRMHLAAKAEGKDKASAQPTKLSFGIQPVANQ